MFPELKIAPEPERLIVRVPLVNAFDEIVVGEAVKFAYVPPTATAETAAIEASVRRILVENMSSLSFRGCRDEDRRRRE
jgi:hypothetical protein